MSLLLRHIARYAVQKLAANPRAREKAAKAARVVVGEVGNLDGATGTELQRRDASMNPVVWCGRVTAGLAAHGPIG